MCGRASSFVLVLSVLTAVKAGQQDACVDDEISLLQVDLKPHLKRAKPHKAAAKVLGLSHPLWAAPELCGSSELRKHPALNFCPPVKPTYSRTHFARFNGQPPDDYWMLDSPAVMSTIARKANLSMWLVNMGANPSSLSENGEREEMPGDDCSPLWYMGYHGVNFDIPQNEPTMTEFYSQWPNAITDTKGVPPPDVVKSLQHHGVPKDLDFLKIDVDSFDCVFLSEILSAGYSPKAMSIECAAPWPPPLKFMVNYTKLFSYEASSGTAMSGCSLSMAADILKPHGYTLLQYAMEDGWFVKNEFANLFGPIEKDVAKVWDVGNPKMYAQFAWLQPPGTQMVQELKELRTKPADMLQKAKQAVQHLLAQKTDLQTADFFLDVGATPLP